VPNPVADSTDTPATAPPAPDEAVASDAGANEPAAAEPASQGLAAAMASQRRVAMLGLAAVLTIALANWWLRPSGATSDTQAQSAAARSHEETFAAAMAYLIRSGEDTIRLDDFHATDAHLEILANVERLRIIRIDGGSLSPASGRLLAAMPHLEQLHLRGIPIDSALLDAISHSTSLWLLNLSSLEASPEAVERLSRMPRLRQLRLATDAGSNQYASAVAASKGLRSVHLIGVKVNNDGLKSLATLPHLESLYLDDSVVTDEGWVWLFDNHPQLHVHIDQQHHDRDPQRH
jgi:hypothetical protein